MDSVGVPAVPAQRPFHSPSGGVLVFGHDAYTGDGGDRVLEETLAAFVDLAMEGTRGCAAAGELEPVPGEAADRVGVIALAGAEAFDGEDALDARRGQGSLAVAVAVPELVASTQSRTGESCDVGGRDDAGANFAVADAAVVGGSADVHGYFHPTEHIGDEHEHATEVPTAGVGADASAVA